MASLLEFIREWMDLRRESKSYCKSCEILREQLSTTNFEKKQLMDRFVLIASKPPAEIPEIPQPLLPKAIPWKVKREMLEAEDRQKAASIRREQEERERAFASNNASAASGEISVEQLEKELGVQ